MRIVVFVLIGLNVLYLAWAGWIDTPASAPPPPPTAKPDPLPQLTLVKESLPHPATPAGGGAAPSASVAAAGLAQPVMAMPATSAGRCVSIGPFNDLAQAARGAALLRDRGFAPKQRAEQGEMWAGYWVSVGGLRTTADEAKLLKALERAGIRDARVMPDEPGGRRMSVGLFSERERADKRAQAVRKLGYSVDVTERTQPGTVYWVDMDVGANDRAVPTEGLLSLEDAGSRIEIRVCPTNVPAEPSRPAPMPRDARPAATTADAGVPRPG